MCTQFVKSCLLSVRVISVNCGFITDVRDDNVNIDTIEYQY